MSNWAEFSEEQGKSLHLKFTAEQRPEHCWFGGRDPAAARKAMVSTSRRVRFKAVAAAFPLNWNILTWAFYLNFFNNKGIT